MSRYVKADMIGCPCGYCEGYDECQKEVDEAPSIDLVRCAECRWSRPRMLKGGETGYRCVFYRVDKAENGYCDCGERKESE